MKKDENKKTEQTGRMQQAPESPADKIEQLEKDSFYLKTLLANTPDHIYFKDEKSRFLKVSDSMAEYFNEKSAEGCLGKTDSDYFSREHAQQALNDEKKIIRTGDGLINVEERETWKGKSNAWVSTTKLPLRADDGKIIGTFGISRTITAKKLLELELQQVNNELESRVKERTAELEKVNEKLSDEIAQRKSAELELQREKDLLAITFSSIGEAVIATDVKCRVQMMNTTAEKLTGWTLAKATGKVISKIITLKGRLESDEIDNPLSSVMESDDDTLKTPPCILVNKQGDEHIVSNTASSIKDSEGQIIGGVIILRDITKQIKLEEDFHRNKNIQSLGNLAAGIAHDFNNYLAGILGNLNLMKLQKGIGVELQTLIDSAERATKGARKLALQLLSFARGGEDLRIQTDITKLVNERAAEIFPEGLYDCIVKAERQLWPLNINTAQIEQVISSVLLNSKESMPQGGKVEISIKNSELKKNNTHALAPGQYIMIKISDSGCGIDSTHLDKVFLPYFTTKKTKSGLGLTTSFSIIQKHKGTISIHSSKTKGTDVEIFIPSETFSEGITTEQNQDIRQKILYMDDNELLLQVTAKMIDNLGYQAVCVTDGVQALETFRTACDQKEKFHAVIMDLTIPGGAGAKEIIKDLRELDPSIYTIISSGYTTDKAITEYKSFGFDAVVTKPFTIDDLKKALAGRQKSI
ncbi:MAG: PAS domain-containing protein [Spirochaetales bacterium]|nr:PAS domain-containing protein [Spirochaetales bacterium]